MGRGTVHAVVAVRLAAAVLLLIVGAMTSLSPVFIATAGETGDVVLCQPAPPGKAFTLVFTHSMYGGEVRETFVVSHAHQLMRTMITTDNAAAAEYYAYRGDVRRIGDDFQVEAPPLLLPELTVRVDKIGNQQLVVGSVRFDLQTLLDGGGPVTLSVRSGSLLQRLMTNC